MEHIGDYISPDVIKNLIFVLGGVFLKSHQFRDESPQKRPFFILNANPKKDNRLVIVNPTTNITGRKKHRPAEVLVEIKPDEYSGVQEHSIVDCDSYIIWYKPVFETQIQEMQPLEPLPPLILERLRTAISKSMTLAAMDKRLVVGEEETADPPTETGD